jgi:adenosylcobinamide kinase / adenosylcobinamide-phosphate guanylyltransferase
VKRVTRPAADRPLLALVTGGARSGKSRFALDRAASLGRPLLFVATAEAGDDEMAARIARHREERAPAWRTIEEPLEVADVLRRESGAAIVLDCLTLWLSNLLERGRDVDAATRDLVAALGARRSSIVVVTNEVGSGIVPEHAVARDFRDRAGFLNRAVAEVADELHLLVCGQPLRVK